MTLTELKYLVALARERHFGRAAQACFVSQPTLSVAIKKLEEELEAKLFERGGSDVTPTDLGARVVAQAQQVLEQVQAIKVLAQQARDPLAGPLRLGVIYTIAPYLLPTLVRQVIARTPQMPLVLREDFTVHLLALLRQGDIDAAILAEPFPEQGVAVAPLYDEPFMVAVPRTHALAKLKAPVDVEGLKRQTMLLLGQGHCFRDQVLDVCPEYAHQSARFDAAEADGDGLRHGFEGSSLETLKHMVASGMGITIVPRLSVPASDDALITYLPFAAPAPARRVVLAWRRSFTRYEAIAALRNAVVGCELPGVAWVKA